MNIVKYDEKYSLEVKNFIYDIMHDEFNKEYKERQDVENIYKVYIDKRGGFWIALDEDKVIGTIGIYRYSDDIGILKRFYLNKKYRGQGIGSALYEQLYNFCKVSDIENVYLMTDPIQTDAHKLYEKKGFAIINELPIKAHYADNDIFYKLDLSKN